jgi:carbon monoxide dehydrogenase subunit G
MQFSGKVAIKADRKAVWDFLTDSEKVAGCAPGLDKLEVIEPGKKFRATTSIGFGAVKVKFVNDVEWTKLDPPNRAAMKAHGKAPGSAVDASTEMSLSDGADGKSTDLDWSADIQVVGTIASMAARLMGSVTKTLTDAFFRKVAAEIEKTA